MVSSRSGVFFFGAEQDYGLGLWSESVGLDGPSSLFVESFHVVFGSERVSFFEDHPAPFESVGDEVVFPSWYGDGEWLPRLLRVGGQGVYEVFEFHVINSVWGSGFGVWHGESDS